MSVIMLVLFFLFFAEASLVKSNQFFEDYSTPQKSNALKGIFVMMVFTSHFCSYITVGEADTFAVEVVNFLGQLMVAPFLFYSGFGVTESIRKKGISYVKKLPVHRALKTLLHFDMAVLMFLVMQLVLGERIAVKDFLLSLVCWVSLGNSTWYIFSVVCLYLVTAAAFSLFRKNTWLAATAATVLSLVLMGILSQTRDSHWYNTMLCYPLGIWFSLLKPYVEKLVMRNDLTYCLAMLVVFGAFCKLKNMAANAWLYNFYAMAFVVLLVGVSMKLRLDNGFLQFLGKYTFGIYILQRIPMIFLTRSGFGRNDTVGLYIICFLITCILAILFEKATAAVDKVLFPKST